MKRRILKTYFFILYILLFSLATSVFFIKTSYAETVNAGLVTGIWYSKYPFYSDDLVSIYSAIQNRSDIALSAKVGFYINNTLIGSTNIEIAKNSISVATLQWKATLGSKVMYTKIIELKTPDGTSVSTQSINTETAPSSVQIVLDPEIVRAEAERKLAEEKKAIALNATNKTLDTESTLNRLATTKDIAPILQNTENSIYSTIKKIGDIADTGSKKLAKFLIDQKKPDTVIKPNTKQTDKSSKFSFLSSSPFLANAYTSIYNRFIDLSATALIFWKLVLLLIILVLIIFKTKSWAKRGGGEGGY